MQDSTDSTNNGTSKLPFAFPVTAGDQLLALLKMQSERNKGKKKGCFTQKTAYAKANRIREWYNRHDKATYERIVREQGYR